MREFNSTGLCVPNKHYMVDISDRVAQVRAMVEKGDYFCINRARQYGKTTILSALRRNLTDDFEVVSLDFQALSHASFATEGTFVSAFCRIVLNRWDASPVPSPAREDLQALARDRSGEALLDDLFMALRGWLQVSERPIVLIIDEVDSATNNQVFLDFLAQLRLQYLNREKNHAYPAFQSVILAGVTDIKHLKSKIRPEDQPKVNSPWNIATDFLVNMSFSHEDVVGMLTCYEADHSTGMDLDAVAEELIAWTEGYPFLVSRLCQLVDERGLTWNRDGVDAAVRLLLADDNVSLFESLIGKLVAYPSLKKRLHTMLMQGESIDFSPYDETQKQLRMYGFASVRANKLVVSNRVFETLLYDYFLGEEQDGAVREFAIEEHNRFVRDGRLNMRAVLEGFRRTYVEVFGPIEEGRRFSEFDGRRQFLLYLKPIINGTGNYYIEAQTRDQTRTDVIVDYLGERFVVELKIWRGRSRHEEGEVQLRGYLERFGLDVGYMLSFNFTRNKEPGLARVAVGDKLLWEETI